MKPETKWPTATREKPCPKCKNTNRCRIAPGGKAGICWRSGSKEVWRDDAAAENGRHHTTDPKPTRPRRTYINTDAAFAAAGQFKDLCGFTPNPEMRELHHDAVGLLIGASERFDPPAGSGESKQFRPAHRLDNGAWAIGDPPGLWPLAGLPMLLALDKSAIVVITEGGKCRNRAEAIGFAATHGAHGSAGAEITDFAPLAGRIIWILADSDTPGRTYAQAVAGKLLALGCKVKIIDLFPDRTDGSDIVEFDAQVAGDPRATKSAIEAVAADTPWLDSLNVIGGPLLTCLADVEPRAVTWLWSGRIPSGRITLLVGRPGEGKSFVTMDVAARVSTGTPFPDGTPCERGSVLIISGEDDPHDTIRPRLDAHHADVSCIHLLSMVRRIGEDGKPLEIMFTLADVTSLEDALCRLSDCRLIIVDPIGSFIGGRVDAHRDNEVRAVLAPVARLAEKYSAAVLIVAHRRKASGEVADDLALGSRAFTGIARAVWHLSHEAHNKDRRLLLPGKCNLSAVQDGLAFSIVGDPPTVCWESDPVTMNADDALAAEHAAGRPGPAPEARDAATDWLRAELADYTEHPVAVLRENAKLAGLGWRTVERARGTLGVLSHRASFSGGYVWRLPKPGGPDKAPPSPPTCPPNP